MSSDDAKGGELSEGEWGAAPKLGREVVGCWADVTIEQLVNASFVSLGIAFGGVRPSWVPPLFLPLFWHSLWTRDNPQAPAGARPPVGPWKQLPSLQRPLTKSCASAPARFGCRFIFGVQGFQSAQKATYNCVLLLVLSFALLPSAVSALASHSTEKHARASSSRRVPRIAFRRIAKSGLSPGPAAQPL